MAATRWWNFMWNTQMLVLPSSSLANTTKNPFYFILTGIPGFEAHHIWISILFCCLYTISIMETPPFSLSSAQSHPRSSPCTCSSPCWPSLTWVSPSAPCPQSCSSFWFNNQIISFEGCFAQLFFPLHVLFYGIFSPTGHVLWPLCGHLPPLHYATTLTNSVVGRMGVSHPLPLCSGCSSLPFPTHAPALLPLPPSLSSLLPPPRIWFWLVCADIQVNSWYAFAVVLLIIVMDPLLIVLSYTLILKSILCTASWTGATAGPSITVQLPYAGCSGPLCAHGWGIYDPSICQARLL